MPRPDDGSEVRSDIDIDAVVRVIHALTIAVGDAYLLPYLNNYTQVVDDDMPVERILESMLEVVIRGIGGARQDV